MVQSPLLQLDREFDFLVPKGTEVRFGQRVSFKFGRSKKLLSGFITELLDHSEYAKTELVEVIEKPVLTPEILRFARQVADRQCVALGEILSLAIPDHMPKIEVPNLDAVAAVAPTNQTREVLLGSGRPVEVDGQLYPDWAINFLERAKQQLVEGRSSILLAPEKADVEMLCHLAQALGVEVVKQVPNTRKSDRLIGFHMILNQVCIVIGTRSAIYAPVANLGLIALSDDLDESYREQGSPHTHARELAMMRAGEKTSLLFAAPYRSLEVERLVEIGYLKEVANNSKPPRISFTEPGLRIDESAFRLVRENLQSGTLLVLLPRKGMAASVWCNGCGERQRCSCGGYIWEPEAAVFQCRICAKPCLKCSSCESRDLRPGRKASGRTLAEIGKAFPKAQMLEATGQKQPARVGKPNQILVATPGSAPRTPKGYSALLILDPDVWLSAQSLQAEQLALRDWCEAIELVRPDGRVVVSGLGSDLGQPLSLWQHREIAAAALQDIKKLGLPPATRSLSVEAEAEVLNKVVAQLEAAGARVLRRTQTTGLFSFSYQSGIHIARALRAVALATSARETSGGRRRGLKIVMDELGIL